MTSLNGREWVVVAVIGGLASTGVFGIAMVAIMAPSSSSLQAILQLVGLVVTVCGLLIALLRVETAATQIRATETKVEEVHRIVNSQKEAMLEEIKDLKIRLLAEEGKKPD